MTLLTIAPVENAHARSLVMDTDDHLRSEVLDRLHASGYLLLRQVKCDVSGGVVTLSGRVPSYHLKSVAQSVLMKIKAVRHVRNLLEVQ
jgi:osmotically-inducible protein OsmY